MDRKKALWDEEIEIVNALMEARRESIKFLERFAAGDRSIELLDDWDANEIRIRDLSASANEIRIEIRSGKR